MFRRKNSSFLKLSGHGLDRIAAGAPDSDERLRMQARLARMLSFMRLGIKYTQEEAASDEHAIDHLE